MTGLRSARMSRGAGALVAGMIAIVLNTAALAAADLIALTTAHGALLRLLVMLAASAIPVPKAPAFQTGFHIVIGLMMALLNAAVLERLLIGPAWFRVRLPNSGMACAR